MYNEKKRFLKSMALGALGITAPSVLSAKNPTFISTYDKMIDQVGLTIYPIMNLKP